MMRDNLRITAITLTVAMAAMALPMLVSRYYVAVGMELCVYLALVTSWMVLCGLSGYLSLGHVVFFGLGAYVAALGWEQAPPLVLMGGGALAAGLLAALVGYPSLRARGPYFVMLTFGLAELVKFIIVKFEAWQDSFGRLMMFGPELPELYRIMVWLAAASFLLMSFVQRSRLGAGLRAIREDEVAAETLGVPAARLKYTAFILSAIIPGAVGALVAMRAGSFEPAAAFDPMLSVTIICMAVIGGSDDARGAILGVAFLILLNKLLWTTLPQLYMVVVGVCLVVFVVFLPEGISGAWRGWKRRRAGPVLRPAEQRA